MGRKSNKKKKKGKKNKNRNRKNDINDINLDLERKNSYSKYKKSTNYFINWLSKSSKLTIDCTKNMLLAVDIVIKKSIMVPISVLNQLSLAINKRSEVAKFYNDSNDADNKRNQEHLYFINILKSCGQKLRSFYDNITLSDRKEEESDDIHSNNMFDELEIIDEVNYDIKRTPLPNSKMIQKIQEDKEWFLNDSIRIATEFFVVDLATGIETVQSLWRDVKKGKRSVLAASIATSTVVRLIKEQAIQYELNFPEVKSYILFLGLVIKAMNVKPAELGDSFKWLEHVQLALNSLTTGMPTSSDASMRVQEGYFGPRFDEDAHPISNTPISILNLICNDFPEVRNILYTKANGKLSGDSGIPFISMFDECLGLYDEYIHYRKSRAPSIALTFAVTCHVLSLYETQGQRFVSRTCSLVIEEAYRMKEVYGQTFNDDTDKYMFDRETKMCIKHRQSCLDSVIQYQHVYRHNPYLCGMLLVSIYLEYQSFCTQLLHTTVRIKTFFHLYNACVACGILESKIDCYEELIQYLGENVLFFAGRESKPDVNPVPCLTWSWSRSCNMTITHMKRVLTNIKNKIPPETMKINQKKRLPFDLNSMSKVYRLLNLSSEFDDFASIQSLKTFAFSVADSMDNIHIKQMSYDLKVLHHISTKILHKIIAELNLESDLLILRQECGEDCRQYVDYAISLLFIRMDGNKLNNVEKSKLRTILIQEHFSNMQTFSINRNAAKFYDKLWCPIFNDEDADLEHFSHIMDILEECRVPMSNEQFESIKALVRKNPPAILGISTETIENGVRIKTPLISIAHHFAGGVVADPRFLEWIIQAGAYHQMNYFYGQSIAHAACVIDNVECLSVLYRESQLCVQFENEMCRTPFIIACIYESKKCLFWLMFQTPANVTHIDKMGKMGHDYLKGSLQKVVASNSQHQIEQYRINQNYDQLSGTLRYHQQHNAQLAHMLQQMKLRSS